MTGRYFNSDSCLESWIFISDKILEVNPSGHHELKAYPVFRKVMAHTYAWFVFLFNYFFAIFSKQGRIPSTVAPKN